MDKSYKYGVITGLFSGITWALYTIINNMITKNIIFSSYIEKMFIPVLVIVFLHDFFSSIWIFFYLWRKKKFFELKKIKEKILLSKEIHYIGDGITSSELIFSGKEFFRVLEFLFENVPEHHYFFDEDRRWCLLIATEGWIAYGEKSIKK